MHPTITKPNFATLLSTSAKSTLLKRLEAIADSSHRPSYTSELIALLAKVNYKHLTDTTNESVATAELIAIFNLLFETQQVKLVHAKNEPEYFPANNGDYARIEFAHGFFASALHEIHTPPYRLTC